MALFHLINQEIYCQLTEQDAWVKVEAFHLK